MNKLRILLLALAYACFWSLFVLFPYPANVLPESHASYVAGPVFASNLITLVTMALMGGVLVVFRDSLAERVAGSTAAIVGSGALLLACAAALVASADAGAVPRWMMAAYPAIMALYGVVIALALAAASRRLTPRDNAVVLALSLLLSFLIGEAIVALTDPLPTGDISNPLMFALSSIFLVILGHIGCDAPQSTASVPPRAVPFGARRRARDGHSALLPTGKRGVHEPLVGGSGRDLVFRWMDSLCLRPRALSGLLPLHPRRMAAAARGLSVARLLHPLHRLSLLHRPALLAVGCAVPGLDPVKSPMAITLLWVAVQEGMGARDLPWWLAAVAAPMLIVAVDCAIHTVGLIGLSPGQMDSVVNAVMLVTAFAMTLGMLWFVRLRPDGAEPASSECAAGAADVSEILAAMADAHGLSEREGEVLGLLYRGNTQKKIAERLFLSVSSVQTYAKSLYRKLGVHSRQELIDMVNEAANGNDRAR
ncbi:helix-turn-helix transcriptional regulator [Adlercreutzia sp. CNCM I-6216]